MTPIEAWSAVILMFLLPAVLAFRDFFRNVLWRNAIKHLTIEKIRALIENAILKTTVEEMKKMKTKERRQRRINLFIDALFVAWLAGILYVITISKSKIIVSPEVAVMPWWWIFRILFVWVTLCLLVSLWMGFRHKKNLKSSF